MDKSFLAAGLALAALPAATLAQGEPAAPAPSSSSCYVEVAKLMAEPPEGIGDLGAAIRELDTKLRPQVEEINALKAEIARLEARQNEAQGGQSSGDGAAEGFGDEQPRAVPQPGSDPTAQRLAQANTELEAKQNQLKLDYAAQQRALVGPVQTRVSERAQAFATQRGCAELKMARAPDLAALTSAGSQNVTGEFVAWYLANRPA
jgi:Skp family chaperone for outer membrane proteins